MLACSTAYWAFKSSSIFSSYFLHWYLEDILICNKVFVVIMLDQRLDIFCNCFFTGTLVCINWGAKTRFNLSFSTVYRKVAELDIRKTNCWISQKTCIFNSNNTIFLHSFGINVALASRSNKSVLLVIRWQLFHFF